jgi:hypothetical protein
MKNSRRTKAGWCALTLACTVALAGCGSKAATSGTAGAQGSGVDAGRIGPAGRGWVANAGGIGVTRDGGRSVAWLATLPVPREQIADVAVLPGSVQVATVRPSGPGVLVSVDGGSRWSPLPVAAASGPISSAKFVVDRAGVVGLQVTDETSSNFSAGEWFSPRKDGTWDQHDVPSGGPVTSAGSALWVAGGPQASTLHRSRDNGTSWAATVTKGCDLAGAAYAPPQENDSGALVLAASAPGPAGDVHLMSCMSGDHGATWLTVASTAVPQNLEPGTVVPSDVGGNSLWFVIPDATKVVRVTSDGTVSTLSPNGLPEGVVSVSAVSNSSAMVTTSTTSCPTDKASCTDVDGVFQTADGGQTWTPVTAP